MTPESTEVLEQPIRRAASPAREKTTLPKTKEENGDPPTGKGGKRDGSKQESSDTENGDDEDTYYGARIPRRGIHQKKKPSKPNRSIKSVLIQLYARPGHSVLDLACGKGGDLIKWDKAKVGYYVGVAIAEGSIKDCMTRYNGDTDQQRRKKFSFPARLLCTDCYEFGLHYSWSTEARARQALANVSALLCPGGIFIGTMPDKNVIIKKLRESEGLEFGNSIYWISFGEEYAEKKFPASRPFGIKYKFHLEDAVDCPEWVVPFHLFKLLAEEYDLELVLMKNFHEFVHEYLQKAEFTELIWRLGALGDGRQVQSTLSQDEWEVSYLYLAFVLRKPGQPSTQRRADNANRGKMFLTEGDIEDLRLLPVGFWETDTLLLFIGTVFLSPSFLSLAYHWQHRSRKLVCTPVGFWEADTMLRPPFGRNCNVVDDAIKNPSVQGNCQLRLRQLQKRMVTGQLHSKWANGPVLPVPESLGRGHILQQERGDQLVS
ncbi:unnamed protein product [Miscanthus lutarioriparius]|uniref:mRNA (guanine-N(7))-methyltransferase n=1 Tax=Miscanthus lutarioriparius TaxID=422564 RepID=A0A811R7I0_9POAL|nr:unnamed protein product [Miscanthus lutarioriparius]